jgi:hypothetical protein
MSILGRNTQEILNTIEGVTDEKLQLPEFPFLKHSYKKILYRND